MINICKFFAIFIDKRLNKFYTIFLFVILMSGVQAQVCLVKNGEPQSRIVLIPQNSVNLTAARLLQDFVKRITDATLPIVSDSFVIKGDVIIGGTPSGKIKEDGFSLSTKGGCLHIAGSNKGNIYGVVTILEKYLNVNYYGENEYTLTKQKDITLPFINFIDNPAFKYRQLQCYALNDRIYRMWFRLDEPLNYFAGGYWVHTFNRLLPAEIYGKAHPEYYAYYNGKRNPDNSSQWCLTNPEVFEIAAHKVDSIFKANPGVNLISVSQNDINNTFCTCENCKKIDEREGSNSGTLIYFLNKLSARFPDKEFSTLAYQYSVKPPKHVKPLPNVNVMLCDINCSREASLAENSSGKEFVKEMEGWSKITKNIFLWDYGINFINYLTPFPNFHIMQDNIRLFKKNNVVMHFSEIGGIRGGDFSELRAFIIAKLMWNPDVNVDSLMQTFLNGYYGKAAPYLYQYLKLIESELISSGNKLLIFDSPVSHKDGMLKPELMRKYNALFDEAEDVVANDSVQLKHVQRSRLSLQYSELEIARTRDVKNLADLSYKLDIFEQRVIEFKVPTLGGSNKSPVEYCKWYREKYLTSKTN